ncbi:MAG: hypothetical protein ACLR09_05180 [Gallintestinimicrobium sp.]
MEQACILLDGGVPIKEIAGLVGYGDVYAFSKQFSRFLDFHRDSIEKFEIETPLERSKCTKYMIFPTADES